MVPPFEGAVPQYVNIRSPGCRYLHSVSVWLHEHWIAGNRVHHGFLYVVADARRHAGQAASRRRVARRNVSQHGVELQTASGSLA